MIVRVIGGNGAGKSHLVHRLLKLFPDRADIVPPGNKKPHMIEILRPERGPMIVMGHYRIANGGVDTMKAEVAYHLMAWHDKRNCDVLYESSAGSDGPSRMLALHRAGHQCAAVLLSTSDDQRVRDVRRRGHNIAEAHIRSSGEKARRIATTLATEGVPVQVLDRDAAFAAVRKLLGV
jgi:ABC-type cobalamin/Fe3+-siderophores transport system ATPase subunit